MKKICYNESCIAQYGNEIEGSIKRIIILFRDRNDLQLQYLPVFKTTFVKGYNTIPTF